MPEPWEPQNPAVRTLWRSRNGGRTWEKCEARAGSVLYYMPLACDDQYDDGYGNLYRATRPDGKGWT